MRVKKKIMIVSVLMATTLGATLFTGFTNKEEPTVEKPIQTTVVKPTKQVKKEKPVKKDYTEQQCTVTYYTASVEECGKSDGITASGKKARPNHTIAADHLPLGTVVEIDGSLFVVEDRFGGNYSNKIDVYTDSREYALKKGVQTKTVKIYNHKERE